MKYSEFFKLVRNGGWLPLRQSKGSHEVWIKDGVQVTIPNHGAKEMPKGTERKLRKRMGL